MYNGSEKVNAASMMQQPMQPPMQAQRVGNAPSSFLHGICVCCTHCDSCLEAWCCSRCQMSRQCNMMKNSKAEIDWDYCLCAFVLDWFFTGGIASVIFVCQAREMMRTRYGIAGNKCSDCCCSWCCGACVLQQQLLEMTSRGEFPGACCYEEPNYPNPARML
ncbi:putative ama1 protein [Leptomonas seymouri]|uniref:Putative ama1 protein n=1 Tax=Leptomonas seymouri TaxID=5684 RepID=A0A0N1PGF6_LEPSE|nr:putative ama1 protein [Leptomonas seymouri]|eukprot:KPI90383.1 putative ama1 protein [Leptomonas seymouri]